MSKAHYRVLKRRIYSLYNDVVKLFLYIEKKVDSILCGKRTEFFF